MEWVKGKMTVPLLIAGVLLAAGWFSVAQAEFYVGGYLGGSLVENSDWNYNNPPTNTVQNVRYDPGVIGGAKFGYFFNQPWFNFPWLGVEVETNVTRNTVRKQQVNLSNPVSGSNKAWLYAYKLYVWTVAFHFVGRYGFLPDKDIPFGRLQPYVGVGPAAVVVYANNDSAKNLALDMMAGLRYMMLKNVSCYVEYKFNHQWEIELENTPYYSITGVQRLGTPEINFTTHRFVFGVAYHF